MFFAYIQGMPKGYKYPEYSKKYYAANKERIKAAAKAWHAQNRARKSRLNRAYACGTSPEAVELLLEQQKGTCAICEQQLIAGHLTHLDHDHKTGKLRALLCLHCNVGLGHFKDNPELLNKAAAYLIRHL